MTDDGMRRLAFFPAGRFSFSSAARLDRVETILAGAGAGASSGCPKLSTFSRAGNFGDISEKFLRKHTRGSRCGHILECKHGAGSGGIVEKVARERTG